MSLLRPYRSLYVHVPFCHGKCDYCAFYSLPESTPDLRHHYLERLARDFAAAAGASAELRSVFIGGGTPSQLAAAELRTLCQLVHASFTLAADCEWTMEANPESLTTERLEAAVEGGVNRLSLGIQSFQPELRRIIGRRGSLAHLHSRLQQARSLGLSQINVDLICQIPGQTPEMWRQDLRQALDCGATHLSTYALSIEAGTPLAARSLPEPADEETDFDDITADTIRPSGLQRYEISNYARPDCRCRHNDEIWHGQTYFGGGPAAVSFDGVNRRKNPDNWEDWLAGTPAELDFLPPERRAAEILAFAFRTLDGWRWSDFRQTTGFEPFQLRGLALERAARLGLISLDADGARPTPQGLRYNDDLLEMLL